MMLTVRFKGRAAHAAMAPFEGINALDAAVLGRPNLVFVHLLLWGQIFERAILTP